MTVNIVLGSLHVLAVAIYIGGLFFMELVLSPAQAAIAPAQGAVISRKAGDRQAIVAWSSLVVILVTGLLRLDRSGGLDPATLADSKWGRTVLAMFGMWCVLVALGLVMTFVLRPILVGKIDPTLSREEQQRRQDRMVGAAGWMGIVMRIDLAVVVTAAVFGESLRWGGIL